MAPTPETEERGGPEPPPDSSPHQQKQEVLLVVHCGRAFLPSPVVLPLPTTGSFEFGRDSLPQPLSDAQLSGRHFLIKRWGDGHQQRQYLLRDLGSKNATYVDGDRLSSPVKPPLEGGPEAEAELRDGAVIRAGNTLMVFRHNFVPLPQLDQPCFIHREKGIEERMIGPFGLRELREKVLALGRLYRKNQQLGKLNVLLEAETGSGKEMLARFVADSLGRAKPFAAVNVPGVVPTLFASEFFGCAKGAYPDAPERKGIVGETPEGCLFLDEIHELDRGVQVQLLRFLQDRDYRRVGESQDRKADVVVLSATSVALEAQFKRDMYERLNQYTLRLPPLRERAEDIPEVCKELLRRQGKSEAEIKALPVEVEAVEFLLLQEWPGNIRGLAAVLNKMLAQSTSKPGLWWWAIQKLMAKGELRQPPLPVPRSLTLKRIERAMDETKKNESQAATLLDINRNKLRRWLGLQK